MEKNKIEILLLLAFELGRNFEQIYLSLDLYNTINFEDLIYAKNKGMKIKKLNPKIENFFKIKGENMTDVEKRKFDRLLELKEKCNNLINYFDKKDDK